MRLGGRLAAAIEIIEEIQARHRPAADALREWGLSHRFAGAGDRAAIGNIVYDALRRRRSAAWLFGEETSRALAFGALLLEWGLVPDALEAQLVDDRFGPPALTAVERNAIAANGLDHAPGAVRGDCPDWCVEQLREAFDDEWIAEAGALASRPPLDLRVNPLRAKRERILQELSDTGALLSDLAPHGIRIAPIEGSGRHPNVQAEPAYRKGWFEIQDEGSQLAAELAGARPGMQVLDYCAGAGGKTLALSAAMENSGQIFAHDSEKQRLAPIFDRLKRSESRNVQVMARHDELQSLAGRMDLVLVDAPCSGSGTWRRRPDAKWRLTPRQLEVRLAEQSDILDLASAYVRPGGRLAYITCSVFAQENHHQIEAFLSRHPQFSAIDHEGLWDTRFPGHAARARIDAAKGILLSPLRSETDGFFFSMLHKAG